MKKETLKTNKPCTIDSVMQGDFFILSAEKGRKEAMQVMECWDKVMTVKCGGGCMTKPYDHFEHITDLSQMREVYKWDWEMEDRRTVHSA